MACASTTSRPEGGTRRRKILEWIEREPGTPGLAQRLVPALTPSDLPFLLLEVGA